MTLEPGHFHAALVQKTMYPQVSPEVDVYGAPGFDLDEHLERIESFNTRVENPTSWRVNVHAGPDALERMLAERRGNVVVLAGRNASKIDYIDGAVENGLHVLADKPWIIHREDLSRLERILALAEARGVVAYDIMTERYEVTNQLQRELVNDPAIFGSILDGTVQKPAVYMRSVHHVMKDVAGVPLRRPVWFFDIAEQGEALADVGTHLVDLSIWTLFPDAVLDYRSDVEVHAARRWPTVMTRESFARVTGEEEFPARLKPWVHDGELSFFANTAVDYTVRGVHVKLDVLWDRESPDHGDTHDAVYRGSRSRVEVRQRADEGWRPEVYVVPDGSRGQPDVLENVETRVQALQARWPGLGVEDRGDEVRITVPDRHRLGHEAHFARVTEQFLRYLERPSSLPQWERSTMLTKYFITTRGTELSQAEP